MSKRSDVPLDSNEKLRGEIVEILSCYVGRWVGDSVKTFELGKVSKNETIDSLIDLCQRERREGAIDFGNEIKQVIRGEGEPGNAGESISVNYVEELIENRLKALKEEKE